MFIGEVLNTSDNAPTCASAEEDIPPHPMSSRKRALDDGDADMNAEVKRRRQGVEPTDAKISFATPPICEPFIKTPSGRVDLRTLRYEDLKHLYQETRSSFGKLTAFRTINISRLLANFFDQCVGKIEEKFNAHDRERVRKHCEAGTQAAAMLPKISYMELRNVELVYWWAQQGYVYVPTLDDETLEQFTSDLFVQMRQIQFHFSDKYRRESPPLLSKHADQRDVLQFST